MTFPYGEAVTLHTRAVTGEDDDGNDVYGDVPTTVTNVPVWPRNSSELVQGQDTLIEGLWALLPIETDVSAVDSVTVYGKPYQVDGEPGRYTSPFTGTSAGVQVALTRVTG